MIKIIMKKKRELTLKQRQMLFGYLFIAPWLIGFLIFFASNLVEAIIYSVSKITINENGSDIKEIGKAPVNVQNRPGFVSTFESFVGENWKSDIKLKSKKWTDADGKLLTSISATLLVKNDGSVTVTYDPTTIKDQTNQ